MPKDIFISYAQGDRQWAEQVCEQLEQAGIECWIAPRDIAPGVTWPAAITEAIRQCRAMIVVFSRHANESRQMAREVEVADSRHVPILPVRVEEIEPAGDMEYFLGNRQWFDLHSQKVERKRALPAAISSLLAQLNSTGVTQPAQQATAPAPPSVPAAKKPAPPVWALAAAVVVAAAVVAGGLLIYSTRGKQPATSSQQPAATSPAAAPPPPATAPAPAAERPKAAAALATLPPPVAKREVTPPAKPVAAAAETTAPPAQAAAAATSPPKAPAGSFEGKWEAEVKYSWGLTRKETFVFRVDGGEVMGTAGYVGTGRGVLDGKIDGNRISFTTRSQTMLGSQTYDEKHVYKGRLTGDTIEFILQTDSGYDARPPEMFTARRVE